MRRKPLLAMVLVIAALFFCYRLFFSSELVAPSWDVWVVDEAGKPLSGITVRRESEDYSCERTETEQDLISDAAGHVHFNPRVLQRSPVLCANIMAYQAQAGVHASFGLHTYVLAFGHGLENWTDDWSGWTRHVDSKLVLRPQ